MENHHLRNALEMTTMFRHRLRIMHFLFRTKSNQRPLLRRLPRVLQQLLKILGPLPCGLVVVPGHIQSVEGPGEENLTEAER